jgi:hypothetical protein
MAGAFEYRQAEEIRDVFAVHGVRYLFIGKSGAILLAFRTTSSAASLPRIAPKTASPCLDSKDYWLSRR